MLHTEVLEPGTFSLLNQLMSLHELDAFALTGGTALALHYGHRKSIDLDLFSFGEYQADTILVSLQNKFGHRFVYREDLTHIGIFAFIDAVKIDIVKYNHPLIRPIYITNSIRFYSLEDIAAMKIQAILGRGTKKDFWDLYELMGHYSLTELFNFHKQKFPGQRLLISLPMALTYFEDAETTPEPLLMKNISWEQVKKSISEAVRNYLQ
ncbi:MAG: nucleotidyl transferase AbiEii/AbiGii toxin family protein [Saprospiraceae bacterium]|nr:nucleotidyl transferase AbiEii/AbiGii toxin family protein [Saprospiraceae bacterium]